MTSDMSLLPASGISQLRKVPGRSSRLLRVVLARLLAPLYRELESAHVFLLQLVEGVLCLLHVVVLNKCVASLRLDRRLTL